MNRKDELAQAKMREYLSRTKTNLEDVMGQLKQMNLGENKSKEFARWLESTANDLKSLDELISSSFAHSPLHFNFNLPLTDQSDSSRLFNNENVCLSIHSLSSLNPFHYLVCFDSIRIPSSRPSWRSIEKRLSDWRIRSNRRIKRSKRHSIN